MDKNDENHQRGHWKKRGKYIFFLLCTLGGADRVPLLRKIGYLFILENVAGTSTVRPFLVHPPVLPHPGKPT